jgi:ssDNA-binding Zn-finger/Zn-ribbon topoisomerase 1
MIERELKSFCSGNKGEESSAYYLDFYFKPSRNWALIHDLRLEHEGFVAQIDHLLIGRMLDIYVIESKNYNQGVAISDEGDFSYFYGKRPIPVESPIAQNERHISLLDRFLTANGLLPRRLGVTLRPSYKNIVLISPSSRLTKPARGLYDCSSVMKSDQFMERFGNDLKNDSPAAFMSLAKVISQHSLRTFAEALALAHKPSTTNYLKKFGLVDEPKTGVIKGNKIPEPEAAADMAARDATVPACPRCGADMVRRTATKGKNAGQEFWGCSGFPGCRGTLQDEVGHIAPVEVVMGVGEVPTCPECGSGMVKRTARNGKNAGQGFWGCASYPKCRGMLALSLVANK